MAGTVYASFDDASLAEKAAGALLDHGVLAQDISIIAHHEGGTDTVTHPTATDRTAEVGHTEKAAQTGISTTTPADAASGAAKGAGIGLGLGVLGGVASLLIPGVGIVVGGGALATAIAAAVGTTAAGAVAGGVTGYLKDQGMEQHVAEDYEKAVRHGGALLEVNLPSGKADSVSVQELLNKYGAMNVRGY